MKLGEFTKYSVKNIFHSENEVRKLVPELFFVSCKVLYKVRASGHHLSFNIFW